MEGFFVSTTGKVGFMEVDQIRPLIKRLYVDGDTILGSVLGALLRDQLPGLLEENVKLSKLIEKKASDLLILEGKTGQDNIYRVRYDENDASSRVNDSRHVNFSNPVTKVNLWRIFCNPKERGSLWIRNIDKGLICSVETSIDQSQYEPLTAFARLTHDEVLDIINNFLKIHRSNEAAMPNSDRYWRDWTSHLRILEHTDPNLHGLVQKWWSFYQYKVEIAFIEKLRILKFSSKDIERSVKTLNASRSAEKQDATTAIVSNRGESSLLRSLVISAVEQLTDEEIAKIALPVGVIVNVTNRSK